MGYALDLNVYEVVVTGGQTATVHVQDIPQSDPVMIILQKQDSENNTDVPQAGARLENAEFTIKYFSESHDKNPENLGIQPTRQWILRTNEKGQSLLSEDFKISGDNLYYTSNGEPTLPIGTITIQETKAPEGYLLNPQIFVQQITSNGSTDQAINTYNAPIVSEQVIRGDLEFTKVEKETGNVMADIPFRITNKATGESHVIVTDENGHASTSASKNSHMQNTNAGQSSTDGIWFGDMNAIDDTKGALPYGDYVLDELECDANIDRVLLTNIEVKIEQNNTIVNWGTLENEKHLVEIGTTAKDQNTGTNEGAVAETVTLVDTVSYSNLKTGYEYTIKGILMDKATNQPLLIDGQQVTNEVKFTPTTPNGTVDVTFTFKGTDLAGKEIVVFETLYYKEKELAVHADIEDEGQTVRFPKIGTTALDRDSGTHNGKVEESITIVDEVRYENLTPGTEYTLKGILMDKATNAPLLVNGEQVTSEVTFIPEQANGTVNVEFTFSSLDLGGKEIVVFEYLYKDGIEYTTHTDITDEGQTVKIVQPGKVVPTYTENGGSLDIAATGDNQWLTAVLVSTLTVTGAVLAVLVMYTNQRRKNGND